MALSPYAEIYWESFCFFFFFTEKKHCTVGLIFFFGVGVLYVHVKFSSVKCTRPRGSLKSARAQQQGQLGLVTCQICRCGPLWNDAYLWDRQTKLSLSWQKAHFDDVTQTLLYSLIREIQSCSWPFCANEMKKKWTNKCPCVTHKWSILWFCSLGKTCFSFCCQVIQSCSVLTPNRWKLTPLLIVYFVFLLINIYTTNIHPI